MKYHLTQRFYFEAAHTLQREIEAEGSRRIHGHTYIAEVTLSGAPQGDRSSGVNGFVLNTITPETATTCHYFWAFARNYSLGEQRLTTEIREGVSGIFREDELILEAQQRAIDENPERVFYNLNIDAGAMWARRLIDRMVVKENPAPLREAAE